MRPLLQYAGIALLVSACATTTGARNTEKAREILMQADRDFDATTATRGIEGWLSWFEKTATQWSGGELIHDRENYRVTLGPLLALPGRALRWQPLWAETNGSLGYTTGLWQLHAPTATGEDSVVAKGRYVTIWRRQTDGHWRAAFDMGSDDK